MLKAGNIVLPLNVTVVVKFEELIVKLIYLYLDRL